MRTKGGSTKKTLKTAPATFPSPVEDQQKIHQWIMNPLRIFRDLLYNQHKDHIYTLEN